MKKSTTILIAVAVAIALIVGIIVAVVIFNSGNEPTKPTGGGVIFDPNQGDDDDADKYVPTSEGVAIAGFGSMTIPPNVTELPYTYFTNPTVNKDKFYMTFELRLMSEDGKSYEVLYKSGNVEAGKSIKTQTLSRGLEAGEYDAVVHIQPYKMDGSPVNNADIEIKLIVK